MLLKLRDQELALSEICKSSSQMLLLRHGKSICAFEEFLPLGIAVFAPNLGDLHVPS